MSQTTDERTDAARSLPGVRIVETAGNRPLRVSEGEVAVVLQGIVDAFFVPNDEEGKPLRPVFVAQRLPGDAVTGGWWRADVSGLPAGEGVLRGVGTASVAVAAVEETALPETIAESASQWREVVEDFARSWRLPTIEQEREQAKTRRDLDAELEAEGQRSLARVFEALPVRRRPGALPPLVRVLADAAQAVGADPEPGRLEQLARSDDTPEDVLELAALLRVPVRRVVLEGRWWKEDGLPLVGFRDGEPLALIPRGRRYVATDAVGALTPVTARFAASLDGEAYAVYPRLPSGGVRARDLLRLGFLGSRRSLVMLVALAALSAALGAFVPYATAQILGVVIPSGNESTLAYLLGAIGAFTVALLAASVAQALIVLGLSTRSGARLTAAVWDRLLHVSPAFFRGRAAGALMQQATAIDQMRTLISSSLVAALAGSGLAVAAIALLFAYSASIGALVLLVFLAAMVAAGLILRRQRRWLQVAIEEGNAVNGLLLGLFSGVSKLRVAGAERRAQALWASGYAAQQQAQRQASLQGVRLSVLQGVLSSALLLGVVVAAAAFEGGSVTLVEFTGTIAASGQLAVAATSIIAVAGTVVQLKPLYQNARPILDTEPEVRGESLPPGDVRGDLELVHVTFGYREGAPVIDGVSLSAPAGSFIAIVGPSGAGKSTLIRLMLGFERPWEGGVLLDGKPLERLDLEAVRRRIGTVIQGARITAGTILTNILGALPLPVEAAWEAAELAGVADDIRAMPMRMSTAVPEGGSGFSGGQLQRILLARALVRKPRILLLDEATSALDNETQRVLTENLGELKVTRIVVAHRLSTIRHADKIVVLDRGRVAEEGTFEELMARDGLFATLARRQLA